MPLLTVTKTYADLQVLNESDLDNIKDSIETFINVTKLDGDNIQNLAITEALIATGAVTETKIGADAVTTSKIKALNVTAGKLAVDSVETAKIKDANVTLAKMAPDSVDSSKIVDGSVAAVDLGTDSVETVKIKDLNVTLGKMAANSVDGSKIVDGSISFADLGFTIAQANDNVNLAGGIIKPGPNTVLNGFGVNAVADTSPVVAGDAIITYTAAGFTQAPLIFITATDTGASPSGISYHTESVTSTSCTVRTDSSPAADIDYFFIAIGRI